MRGYKTLIQEAELMAMSPKAVAEFLKKRASQSKDEALDDSVDEEAEKALPVKTHHCSFIGAFFFVCTLNTLVTHF